MGRNLNNWIFNPEDSNSMLNNEMSEALLRKRLSGNSNDRLSKIKLRLHTNPQGKNLFVIS